MSAGELTTATLLREERETMLRLAWLRGREEGWRHAMTVARQVQSVWWYLGLIGWMLGAISYELALSWMGLPVRIPLLLGVLVAFAFAVVIAFIYVRLTAYELRTRIGKLANETIRSAITFRFGLAHGAPHCRACGTPIRSMYAAFADPIGEAATNTQPVASPLVLLRGGYHPLCLCHTMKVRMAALARAETAHLLLTREARKQHERLDAELRAADQEDAAELDDRAPEWSNR